MGYHMFAGGEVYVLALLYMFADELQQLLSCPICADICRVREVGPAIQSLFAKC